MSRTGNHVVGMQSTPEYERGWRGAEEGLMRPVLFTPEFWQFSKEQIEAIQRGWDDYHAQEQS